MRDLPAMRIGVPRRSSPCPARVQTWTSREISESFHGERARRNVCGDLAGVSVLDGVA